jgi:hypothetical protein
MAFAYILAFMLVAYVVLSFVERRQDRAFGKLPSKELRKAVWLGIFWINVPILPLLIGPLLLWLYFVPGSGLISASFFLLLGFLVSWAWWSVSVSLWRRWAARRGIDPEELQCRGQSASILWPKGHFFERTELDRLRRKHDA